MLKLNENQVTSFIFNNEENQCIVANSTGTIKFYDIKSGQIVKEFQQMTKSISSLALTTNDGFLAVGYYDGQVNFIELNQLQLIQEINDQINKQVDHLIINQSNNLVAFSKDKHVSVWNLRKMEFVSSQNFDSKITFINFHYTDNYLFISTQTESHLLDLSVNCLSLFDQKYLALYSPLIFNDIDKRLYCGISKQGVTLIEHVFVKEATDLQILSQTQYNFDDTYAFAMRRNSLVPQIIVIKFKQQKIIYEIVNLKNFEIIKQKVSQSQNKVEQPINHTQSKQEQKEDHPENKYLYSGVNGNVNSNPKKSVVAKSLYSGKEDTQQYNQQHIQQQNIQQQNVQQQHTQQEQYTQQHQQSDDQQTRNHLIRMKQLENMQIQINQILSISETKDLLYDNILRADIQIAYLLLKQLGTDNITLTQSRKIIQYFANQLELFELNKIQYNILQFICQTSEKMCLEFKQLIQDLLFKQRNLYIDKNDLMGEQRAQNANQMANEVSRLATCLSKIDRSSRERSIQDLCKQSSQKLNKVFQ